MEVEHVNGNPGELTVLVNGAVVARKWLLFKPSIEKVLAAVRAAAPGSTAT